MRQIYDLPKSQFELREKVLERIGPVAATSLDCVLLDGIKRFVGLTEGEADFIRQIAKAHEVELPI